MKTLRVTWGVSRGRNTYGYTTCTLRDERGVRRAACNGGGYDMLGTVLGNYIASEYRDRLMALKPEQMPEQSHWNGSERVSDGRYFYGLTYHDPTYDPGKAVIGKDADDRTLGGSEGKTVEQAEHDGDSLGLERYQAFYRASSPFPTDRHTVPLIDGATGYRSVLEIAKAIGVSVTRIEASKKLDLLQVSEIPQLVDSPDAGA